MTAAKAKNDTSTKDQVRTVIAQMGKSNIHILRGLVLFTFLVLTYTTSFCQIKNVTCTDNKFAETSERNFPYRKCFLKDTLEELDFSGELILYSNSDSTKILQQAFYLNGLKNGPFSSYYSNGTLESSGTYKDGKPIGIWEIYFATGQITQEYLYFNDEFSFRYVRRWRYKYHSFKTRREFKKLLRAYKSYLRN